MGEFHGVIARAQKGAVIGVISDTHGLLRPEALKALRGSDYIIHAGDIGDPSLLDRLEEVAPVSAVRGNVDHGLWATKIQPTNTLEVEGISLYVLHNLAELDIKPEAGGFSAVIYGHSHVPKQEIKNGVLYFNPGSAGPRRFRLPVTIGKIRLHAHHLDAEIVDLAIG
ncbi:MAG: metallophosphoesterase family protein [Acidobacteria bacterium]|nr:metallophosphoesterase family protein [Acidobacteriota bacterium]